MWDIRPKSLRDRLKHVSTVEPRKRNVRKQHLESSGHPWRNRPHWVIASCVCDCPEHLDFGTWRVPEVPASLPIDRLPRNCAIKTLRHVEPDMAATCGSRPALELSSRGIFQISRVASLRQAWKRPRWKWAEQRQTPNCPIMRTSPPCPSKRSDCSSFVE